VPRPFTAGRVADDPVWALRPALLTGRGLLWDEPEALAAAAVWDAY
jgi:hypothetical protein